MRILLPLVHDSNFAIAASAQPGSGTPVFPMVHGSAPVLILRAFLQLPSGLCVAGIMVERKGVCELVYVCSLSPERHTISMETPLTADMLTC